MNKVKVDTNKLHAEEFQRIIQNLDRNEAKAAIYILVRKFPDMILEELKKYLYSLANTVNALTSIVKGDD